MNHFKGDPTYFKKKQRQPNNTTPYRQLLKMNLAKKIAANKLNQKKTDQRIKTPIKKRKTNRGEFRS